MGVDFSARARAWLLACPQGIRRTVCAVHLAAIAVLSLLPAWLFPPAAAGIPGIDKVVHAAMYGVLGALFRWAAGPKVSPAGRWLPAAAAGYGLLMEFLQLEFSGGARMFSWGDAAANLAGAFLFWSVAGRFLGKREIQDA